MHGLRWLTVTAFTLWATGAQADLKAYVTNGGSNSVSAIDLSTHQVEQTFSVGVGPVGIAADTNRHLIYVANSGSASVTKINVLTGQYWTLDLPGSQPEDVVVSPAGDMILVSSLERVTTGTGSRGVVYAIDGTSFTLIQPILVSDDPEGLVISEDGNLAWIASDEKVQELDLQTTPTFLQLSDVISGVLGVDDFEEVAVTSNKATLFATNARRVRVDVIDLSTETIIDTVPAIGDPEAVEIRPGSDEVHVTDQAADAIITFSLSTHQLLTSATLSRVRPLGLAFTPDGAEAYVAMQGSDVVIRYDASTLGELGEIPVGIAPEEIVIMDVPGPLSVNRWEEY